MREAENTAPNAGLAWRVEVFGVRGAIPVPDADFLAYGGNTSCILLERGEDRIVFDAGSGLTRLGARLRRQGRKRADILISHLHIDHLSGLFGFPLLFDPQAEVHLYGWREGGGFAEALTRLIGAPYWPLGLADFPARVAIHEISAGESFCLAGKETGKDRVIVRTLPGRHPGGSLIYRVEAGAKSVLYASDCEADEEMRIELEAFARDGTLLIWDANFSGEDLAGHSGWGHSSWPQGIALQRAAGVRQVLMTHYSYEYTDSYLQEQQKLAESADACCLFAKEGMVMEL